MIYMDKKNIIGTYLHSKRLISHLLNKETLLKIIKNCRYSLLRFKSNFKRSKNNYK